MTRAALSVARRAKAWGVPSAKMSPAGIKCHGYFPETRSVTMWGWARANHTP